MIDYAYTVELSIHGTPGSGKSLALHVIGDSIQGYSASMQDVDSNARGDCACPRLDFTAWASKDLLTLMLRVVDPSDIRVELFEQNRLDKVSPVRRFVGRLVTMPQRSISSTEDTFDFNASGYLTFMNEVAVTDPISSVAYRDEYIDDLINDLLDAADHPRRIITTAPPESDIPFTSRLFYPGKHRFDGRSYNITDDITAFTTDGTNIWIGVGHWLCRYNPITRERTKVAVCRYVGALADLKYLREWQFRIKSLAYDAGTIYGWAETTWSNLRDERAHFKLYFTYAAGDYVDLTDTYQSHNYDRGYYVKSRYLLYHSYGGPDGLHWADLSMESVGDAQPTYTDKLLGILLPTGMKTGTFAYAAAANDQILYVTTAGQPIYVRDNIQIYDSVTSHRQNLGDVTEILESYPTGYKIKVQYPLRNDYPAGTDVSWWPEAAAASPNLFLPGYRRVSIEYDEKAARKEGGKWTEGPSAVDVRVEHRRTTEGSPSYFWPQVLGSINAGDGLDCLGPLLALGEGNEPGQYDYDPGTGTYYYASGTVPEYHVLIENGAHFANLPVNGYWVRNDRQASHKETQPGMNTLVYNGVPVTISNEHGAVLESRGNIWLAVDEDGHCYVAWNRWQARGSNWFLQCVWASLNAGVATIQGRDRTGDNYTTRSMREITGFAVHYGRYWLATKRVEPRWVDTDIRIIWAAPPQNQDKPIDYDGGNVAVAMVLYDKADDLKAGTYIKVRGSRTETPGTRVYFISESSVLDSREITSLMYSSSTYGPEQMTYMVIYDLGSFTGGYIAAARAQLLDKFITVQKGIDVYGEICYAGDNQLIVSKTATAAYGEAFDGDAYDAGLEKWRGEEVTPVDDGRWATVDLAEKNVVTGSVIVTMKEGKQLFTLTDKTADVSWDIPPLGEVYIRRQEGTEYKTCRLYLNLVYAGDAFNVDYNYYPEREYGVFVRKGTDLYCHESTGDIYVLDGLAWTRRAAWPQSVVNALTHGDDIYALGADGALMRYGKIWPGYINAEVGGAPPTEIDVFNAIFHCALAADCYCGEENGTVIVKPREYTADEVSVNIECLGYETLTVEALTQYLAVLVRYNGGAAYIGPLDIPQDRIYEIQLDYVNDYGHAYLLAQRYFDYYRLGVEICNIDYGREGLSVPTLGAISTVPSGRGDVTGRVVAYLAKGPRVNALIERTVGDKYQIGTPLGENMIWA